ncbi:hypothetical protein R3P38DRAFT_2510437, partial [Favolaschia claudopus]
WQKGDIWVRKKNRGESPKALASIIAKVVIMSSRSDMYLPPEDSEQWVKHLKGKL